MPTQADLILQLKDLKSQLDDALVPYNQSIHLGGGYNLTFKIGLVNNKLTPFTYELLSKKTVDINNIPSEVLQRYSLAVQRLTGWLTGPVPVFPNFTDLEQP